jgi:hypothetical protein
MICVSIFLSLVIRRSLNLIECLLRIADAGFYPIVLDIFKHGSQRAGEVIFLGLLQLPVSLEKARQRQRVMSSSLSDHLDDTETRTASIDHSDLSSEQSECQCSS